MLKHGSLPDGIGLNFFNLIIRDRNLCDFYRCLCDLCDEFANLYDLCD